MISTCCLRHFEPERPYQIYTISRTEGRHIRSRFSSLIPNWSHETETRLKENSEEYITRYYDDVLSKLDPKEIQNKLDNGIILSEEEGNEFGYRHIVAAWLEILLDTIIPEITLVNGKVNRVNRPPYIKEQLENIMKRNRNMRCFHSLRALYLFEKAEELEEFAKKLGEKDYRYYEYMQEASYLRCNADEAESHYLHEHRCKIKEV